MKAVVFGRFGPPGEVLQLRDVPRPGPGRGQVRVRMIASPVNPSDLLVVRGEYPRLPALPATPGFEGVGVVDAAGPGLIRHLRGLSPGRRVAVLNALGGNWQEHVVIPARQAVPVPSWLPEEQAAMFFVNPATALVMTRYVLKVPRGAWLLQTAAGSALGRMVIRLGKHFGFRTLNVVRRREQVRELLDLGADAALSTEDGPIASQAAALTGGVEVRYALDAVGGATGSEVVRALAAGGRLLAYGLLSGEPLTIESRALMTGHRRVEGFWLSHWAGEQSIWTLLRLFGRIFDLMRAGVLTSEAGASFPLEEVRAAAAQAVVPGRQGKVLLRFPVG